MEDPGTNDTICVLRLLYTAYLTLTVLCRESVLIMRTPAVRLAAVAALRSGTEQSEVQECGGGSAASIAAG